MLGRSHFVGEKSGLRTLRAPGPPGRARPPASEPSSMSQPFIHDGLRPFDRIQPICGSPREAIVREGFKDLRQGRDRPRERGALAPWGPRRPATRTG